MLDNENVYQEEQLNIFYLTECNNELDEGNYSYPPVDTELSREVDRLIDELIGEQ